MTVLLYGINNCDTCRKARRWLDDQGISYQWHDIRRDGLSPDDVHQWLDDLGTQKLVNRRGRSWRELDDATKASLEAGGADAFLANPTVIKRPILTTGQKTTVGFSPDDWKQLLTKR